MRGGSVLQADNITSTANTAPFFTQGIYSANLRPYPGAPLTIKGNNNVFPPFSITEAVVIKDVSSIGIGISGTQGVITSPDGVNLLWNGSTINQALSISGDIISLTGDGSVNIATATTVAENTQKLTAITYDGGLLNTFVDGILSVSNNEDIAGSLTVGSILTPTSATINGVLSATTFSDISGSTGSSGQFISAGTGGQMKWADVPTVSYFRPTNMWYVAKNGSDISGDGSYSKPFLTIQKGVDTIEDQPSTAGTIGVLNINPGHYTEDIIFTRGYICLIGVNGNTQDGTEITEINGHISVALTQGADDKFNKVVLLSNILFSEVPDTATALISDTSTKQHTLTLQNCYVFGNGTLLHQNSSADCVSRLTQVKFNQDGGGGVVGATLRFSIGTVYMERCDVDTNQNTNSMLVENTAIISRCGLCSFENTFASVAGAIVRITNASLHSFGNCSFLCVVGTVFAIQTTVAGAIGTSGINLVQCSFVVSGSGVPVKAVSNAGYVYTLGNGAFVGTASGYSGSLVVPYTAM